MSSTVVMENVILLSRLLTHQTPSQVVGELWRPAGGAYNVDGVLRTMVRGLEEELDARMSGTKVYAASQKRPSSLIEVSESSILKDGALPSTPDDFVKVRG
jgi:hypothetical protein